jgi:hypothetical protein
MGKKSQRERGEMIRSMQGLGPALAAKAAAAKPTPKATWQMPNIHPAALTITLVAVVGAVIAHAML